MEGCRMAKYISRLSLYIVITIFIITIFSLITGSTTPAFSQSTQNVINSGDTAWMLISTVLVLMMTIPGLFLFYSGLVRSKNSLSTIMHSFFIVAIVSVQWVLIGYTLAFGPDINGFIGGLKWLGLHGVGVSPDPVYAYTIPHYVFMAFQLTFAIITPALITGAFAERIKFSAFVIFAVLWTTLIYDPLAHWVWGGGWIGKMGALDFAGGTVVHISSGASALAAVIILGKRRGYGHESMAPHMLPFSIIGASLLWVGWFGFNAGSALAANGLAALAFITTNTAAASAVISWTFTEWILKGKPTVLGAASGAVSGLVAITPAAGFVTPVSAIVIGAGGGIFCYLAINLKFRFGYDDALDVVGVHGVGGTWGAIATGLFATIAVNEGGSNGLFYGNPGQLLIQVFAVLATIVFTFIGTIVIFTILKYLMGLRVSAEAEYDGLDIGEHGEVAYSGFQTVHGERTEKPR